MILAAVASSSFSACAALAAAFRPAFLLRLIAHCHWRAVAASVAPLQSLRMLVTSSVSRMLNVGFKPSASPSSRNMRTPSA